jgi:hypothetical protein
MTNVDFFREFAANTEIKDSEYFIEHTRIRKWDANLYDGDDNLPVKMFHYTLSIQPIVNDVFTLTHMEYRGSIFCLVKSDLDDLVDKDVSGNKTGKYDTHVKPLIDAGGIIALINKFNRCRYDIPITYSRVIEVYNDLDFNGDGILIEYVMRIDKNKESLIGYVADGYIENGYF